MSSQRTPVNVDADRQLTSQQQSIVDYILTTGQTVKETSEQLGIDVSNVYRTLRLSHVKRELHSRTLDHIGILAPYAARKQEELLNADSDHVRAAVAENILDRHLGKPVMRQQIALLSQINVHIDLS